MTLSMQRVISFDIGIKNMAYCIFDLSIPFQLHESRESLFKILDWGVLNLLPENIPCILCNQGLSIKKEKGKKKIENFFTSSVSTSQIPENKCGKPAKYQNGTQTFCEKHAKASSYKKISLPTKMASKTILELQLLYDQYVCSQITNSTKPSITDSVKSSTKPSTEGLVKSSTKPSKKGIIEDIQRYVENHGLKPIKKVKTATSNTIDLISIGHALNRLLTEVLEKVDSQRQITHVIIENQISPIANRMKTVQGMLAQYFIMKYGETCHIEFISSVNKLKIFEPSGSKKIKSENPIPSTGGFAPVQNVFIGQSAIQVLEESKKTVEINPDYKQHKKDGIFYCRGILESNSWLRCHIESLNTKKKDDLADCFLQGIWYLVREKRIMVAENLKINSVIKI